ncbi:MAG: ribonuclease P protein component [Porticoccaceae bacterium]|nr:ribonuclease P protein component [Porticoccaceae bacterium]
MVPEADSQVGNRFPRSRRLLKSSEFQAVFAAAEQRVSHRYYLLLARTTMGPGPRLGLVVARKNIRLATRRNRIKRVARETFRQQAPGLGSVDVLFLPRRGMDVLPPDRQTRLLREAWRTLAKALEGDPRPCSPEP